MQNSKNRLKFSHQRIAQNAFHNELSDNERVILEPEYINDDVINSILDELKKHPNVRSLIISFKKFNFISSRGFNTSSPLSLNLLKKFANYINNNSSFVQLIFRNIKIIMFDNDFDDTAYRIVRDLNKLKTSLVHSYHSFYGLNGSQMTMQKDPMFKTSLCYGHFNIIKFIMQINSHEFPKSGELSESKKLFELFSRVNFHYEQIVSDDKYIKKNNKHNEFVSYNLDFLINGILTALNKLRWIHAKDFFTLHKISKTNVSIFSTTSKESRPDRHTAHIMNPEQLLIYALTFVSPWYVKHHNLNNDKITDINNIIDK